MKFLARSVVAVAAAVALSGGIGGSALASAESADAASATQPLTAAGCDGTSPPPLVTPIHHATYVSHFKSACRQCDEDAFLYAAAGFLTYCWDLTGTIAELWIGPTGSSSADHLGEVVEVRVG